MQISAKQFFIPSTETLEMQLCYFRCKKIMLCLVKAGNLVPLPYAGASFFQHIHYSYRLFGSLARTDIRTISAAEGSVPGRSERLSFRPFVVSAFCPYRRQPLPTPVPTAITGAAGLPGPSADGLNSSPAPLLVLI